LLFKAGRIVLDDLPGKVVENYLSQAADGIHGGCFLRNDAKPTNSVFFVRQVTLVSPSSEDARSDFDTDESVVIRVSYIADSVVKGLYGYITLQRSDGTLVYEGDSFDTTPNPFDSMKAGEGSLAVIIPKRHLAPGKHLVYLSFDSTQDPGHHID